MKWPLVLNTKSATKTLKQKIPSGLNYSYIAKLYIGQILRLTYLLERKTNSNQLILNLYSLYKEIKGAINANK
jgi:hypothetical protein